MGIAFFMIADKLAKLKDKRDSALSHTDKDSRATVSIIEQWHGNDMIRYTRNTDGSKTVLEHYTNAVRPFVKVNWADLWTEHDLSNPNPALSQTDKLLPDAKPEIGQVTSDGRLFWTSRNETR